MMYNGHHTFMWVLGILLLVLIVLGIVALIKYITKE